MADERKQKKKKIKYIYLVILVILILLLFLFVLYYLKYMRHDIQPLDIGEQKPQIISPVDTAPPVKKTEEKKQPKTVVKKQEPVKDTVVPIVVDTAPAVDTTPVITGCAVDTIPPWVFPDPSGGLHYGKIFVQFVSNKPCTIQWKTDKDGPWHTYTGDSIVIEKDVMLYYQAYDSCDNWMNMRSKLYEIRPREHTAFCPDDMVYVAVGQSRFCIDRYEWPNRRDTKPDSYISIYHAMDSCFTAGKRLCTTDEWSLACAGIYSWKYPYGDMYESNACVTRDTSVQPSGKLVECRNYFGIYDMAGNLAEWTDTRAAENKSFYNVMGGFWESGPQSTCFDARYSYFPQNQHNPVGFRCCKDINPDKP